MANFDRSYIKKILCPHTQMITWEASTLLGPDLCYSTLFDFFGHILLCTNWNWNRNWNREPGNGDFGTVEPGNDFSGSGNLPSDCLVKKTENSPSFCIARQHIYYS